MIFMFALLLKNTAILYFTWNCLLTEGKFNGVVVTKVRLRLKNGSHHVRILGQTKKQSRKFLFHTCPSMALICKKNSFFYKGSLEVIIFANKYIKVKLYLFITTFSTSQRTIQRFHKNYATRTKYFAEQKTRSCRFRQKCASSYHVEFSGDFLKRFDIYIVTESLAFTILQLFS